MSGANCNELLRATSGCQDGIWHGVLNVGIDLEKNIGTNDYKSLYTKVI